jgi:hypothetical protein
MLDSKKFTAHEIIVIGFINSQLLKFFIVVGRMALRIDIVCVL